jgi:hypothetical protein
MKLPALGQRGHISLIVPAILVAAIMFAGIQVYNNYTHAQTVPCKSQTFTTTSSTTPVLCVQYIQQMLNGIYAYNVGSDPSNGIVGLGKNPTYAKLMQGSYKSDLLLVNNQFGNVSSIYGSVTTNQVAIFQRSAFIGTAQPPAGKVDSATWQELCSWAVTTQLKSNGTLVDRDVAVSTHTPEGYADSYRRAGVSAGRAAGCTMPSVSPAPVPTNFNECMELGGTETQGANSETCTLDGKKFTVASDDVPGAWGHVSTSAVSLLKWKVTFTAPQDLVGDLYYQVDPGENIYDFTTTKMFAPACIAYFNAHNQEASVEFDQYPTTKAAAGIAPNPGTQTLMQYYTAHKSTAGNYFLDSHNRKVWLEGNHFYEFLTDTSLYQGTAFTTACPGVTSQYQAELANAIPTLKE